ncbi:DUF1559 family PulG-like putative transporter [Planctomicrobium piriforme]|uniref:Prepilin-type N-terminal cleavage/methylation domain-containing protein n=1 Tax=Planctomicrobium piriforme TaxID=1576369 RepID=A0A1I3C7W9_9PLAN|nr:DUF1559 domain-containing protein [Planctomicrobium piriforme]SFH70644.1 prepilin-type N-terminal cleavage/methylation domain-containing protein [Planctomicrobium piriforme]
MQVHPPVQQPPTRAACRQHRALHGLTILEVLVCLSVIGILSSLLLPALSSAREAARQVDCRQRLKQLGLALHSYHEVHNWLPAGWQWESTKQTAFGWLPPLLPHLEMENVSGQFDSSSQLGSAPNTIVRSMSPALFRCPSDIAPGTFTLFLERPSESSPPTNVPLLDLPTANFVGVFGTPEPDNVWQEQLGDGPFCGATPVSFPQFLRGLSNVLLVGERQAATVPSTWLGVDFRGEDAACRLLGNAERGPNKSEADECEFTSRHPGCVHFLWGDGRVTPLSDAIDSRIYQQLAKLSEF